VEMSKKSYKRNQNRLYREIKRRIIAEQALKFPVPVIPIHRDIETVAIRNIVRNCYLDEIEFIKTDMATKLAKKLVAEGFVQFFSRQYKYEPTDVTEIDARICVVKPTQEGLENENELFGYSEQLKGGEVNGHGQGKGYQRDTRM